MTSASKATPSLDESKTYCEIKSYNVGGLAYSGDVSPTDAHDYLKAKGGILVDVRTPEEWAAVGIPSVDAPAELHTISWKLNPGYVLNEQFPQQLEAALGGRKDATIFFMCKGGGRSLDAAVEMTKLGYEHCYNVAGGYEGRPDIKGWAALGLPIKAKA